MFWVGGLGQGFQAGEGPEGVGELVAHAADAAIGKAFGEQAVAAESAALGDSEGLEGAQELESVDGLGFQLMEERPILASLALADEGEESDGGVFPVLFAAGAGDLAGGDCWGAQVVRRPAMASLSRPM